MEFENKIDFTDPYEDLPLENVIYTTENIPIKETEELFNDIFSSGCKCNNLCLEPAKCTCIKQSINYKINDNNKPAQIKSILHTNYILNPQKTIIYECNQNCKCSKICGNKLVQYGPRNHLEIKQCKAQKGHGLFTNKNILKGNFICEYAGELITKTEATKRFKHNEEKNTMNYIICAKEFFGDSLQETIIDPTYFGNIGRFLNHSCDPNCELIPVRIDSLVPKLCIFARRDIEENSELTFDYGDGESDLFDGENKLKKCLCGEKICRKWMPFNKNIIK